MLDCGPVIGLIRTQRDPRCHADHGSVCADESGHMSAMTCSSRQLMLTSEDEIRENEISWKSFPDAAADNCWPVTTTLDVASCATQLVVQVRPQARAYTPSHVSLGSGPGKKCIVPSEATVPLSPTKS